MEKENIAFQLDFMFFRSISKISIELAKLNSLQLTLPLGS